MFHGTVRRNQLYSSLQRNQHALKLIHLYTEANKRVPDISPFTTPLKRCRCPWLGCYNHFLKERKVAWCHLQHGTDDNIPSHIQGSVHCNFTLYTLHVNPVEYGFQVYRTVHFVETRRKNFVIPHYDLIITIVIMDLPDRYKINTDKLGRTKTNQNYCGIGPLYRCFHLTVSLSCMITSRYRSPDIRAPLAYSKELE